jgi:hypothetical protein
MLKKTFAILLLLTANTAVFAEHCGQLNILVFNDTHKPCHLKSQNFISGSLESGSPIPSQLAAKTQAAPFTIRQNFYGPKLILTYQCGKNAQITFESSQSACYFSSGAVSANIKDRLNLSAYSHAQDGSYIQSKAGLLSWVIEKR